MIKSMGMTLRNIYLLIFVDQEEIFLINLEIIRNYIAFLMLNGNAVEQERGSKTYICMKNSFSIPGEGKGPLITQGITWKGES